MCVADMADMADMAGRYGRRSGLMSLCGLDAPHAQTLLKSA